MTLAGARRSVRSSRVEGCRSFRLRPCRWGRSWEGNPRVVSSTPPLSKFPFSDLSPRSALRFGFTRASPTCGGRCDQFFLLFLPSVATDGAIPNICGAGDREDQVVWQAPDGLESEASMSRGSQSQCDGFGFVLIPIRYPVLPLSGDHDDNDPVARLVFFGRPLWAILEVESWASSLRPRRISEFRSRTPTGMAV